jgi:large repetitive protein
MGKRRNVTGSSASDGHAAPRTGSAYVYVTNLGDNNVSVIDTEKNIVVGEPIKLGTLPSGVGIVPAAAGRPLSDHHSNPAPQGPKCQRSPVRD